jgi:hypothetical protein
MSLWWLCYRRSDRIEVAIVEGLSLIHAHMRPALYGINADATFTQGHELDTERAARVPREYVGRMLSREQAAGLLERIERSGKARSISRRQISR